jgi:hypothetical protein
MKYAARTATLILAGFLAMASTCERAAGQHGGGGHGGFGGGHGFGGHGGHSSGVTSSGGHSSGHSIGHSIGHSLARLFGHRGQGSSSATLVSAPANRRTAAPPPNSVPKVLHSQPKNRFIFRHGNGFFRQRGAFSFAGCFYGWFDLHFGFDDDWNCRNDAFFVDPFFFGWSSGPLLYGPAFGSKTWFEGGMAPESTVGFPAEANPAYPPIHSDATNETPHFGGATSSPNDMKAERPVTLLQLRDGSMYGLTDYWVKAGELHYTTTYGGQDLIPLKRIDFEKTVRLNAERGVPFALPPESVPR